MQEESAILLCFFGIYNENSFQCKNLNAQKISEKRIFSFVWNCKTKYIPKFFTVFWKQTNKKVAKCKILDCFCQEFWEGFKKDLGTNFGSHIYVEGKGRVILVQTNVLVLPFKNHFQHAQAFGYFIKVKKKTIYPKECILEILCFTIVF